MLSVTTKTGDKGKSSLADGTRLLKDHPVFEVIGTIDELNSHLGLVIAGLKQVKVAKLRPQTEFLTTVQHELFTLGGEVAGAKVQISQEFLQQLEDHSTKLQQTMAEGWHHQFVLPGGHEIAARLDIARAVCRRLERRIVTLSKKRKTAQRVFQTINRLSDYLYVLRCYTNQTLHKPEKFFVRAKSK